MRAVYHHNHLGLALLDRCLADQVPDVGHRGKDNPLVRSDTQVVLSGTRDLEEHKFEIFTFACIYKDDSQAQSEF